MPDTPGSLIRRAALAACIAIGSLVAVPAAAQQPGPQPLTGPSERPDFMSRYDLQLTATGLSGDDPRFSWQTHFGGALDLFDYKHGRASVVADYEAVLGHEYRPFDPNQAYYVLETSASVWAGKTELAGVFHHVSRHISDRDNPSAFAWNVLEARVLRVLNVRNAIVSIRAEAGRVTQRVGVDYTWTAATDVALHRRFNPRFGVYGRGFGELFGVDPAVRGRDAVQRSGHVEGGVRIEGRAGAMELFAGYEQRHDPTPFEFVPKRWVVAGFRLLTR